MKKTHTRKLNIIASSSLVIGILMMATVHEKPFTWRFEGYWIGYFLDLLTVLFFLPLSIATTIWLLIQFNKKYTAYKKANIIFYVFLLANSIIGIVPIKYRVGMYSPSVLGCIYVVTFFLVIPLFFRLFYLDYKSGDKKNIIIRSIAFVMSIIIYMVLWQIRSPN
ncbi:MAG: hypothetical protein HRT69_02510 [Flavobacteriaceae bacterium]|nr:hypothetical protein [Flavobacteriaceae bacterium]